MTTSWSYNFAVRDKAGRPTVTTTEVDDADHLTSQDLERLEKLGVTKVDITTTAAEKAMLDMLPKLDRLTVYIDVLNTGGL